MIFDLITLFPQLIEPHLTELPFKRASDLGVAKYKLHQLRDYAVDARGTVDDKPYGGGVGMVLMVEPIQDALNDIKKSKNTKVISFSPRGKKFTQKYAETLLSYDHLIMISGRYEGIDARVEDNLVDDVLSIGDYTLSGGEIPALVVMEAVTRLLPGVLEKKEIEDGEKLFPQYTRPEDFKGMRVPETLLSGNHKEIQKWQRDHSVSGGTSSSIGGASSVKSGTSSTS